ncbi:MAG: hypothetical protein EBV58_04335 [Actinobacteria bacterium]|nr:hypothetical protein [Actinomycetota bacterium]
MHNGFVVDTEGEKMSKSLGNVTNLPDLLDRYDARAYRMLLLQTHYRSPVKVGLDNIDASVNALAGIDSFAARTGSLSATADTATLDAFRTAMNDDLNTPVAMGVLFDAVRRANVAVDAGDNQTAASVASAVREMCAAIGLQLDVARTHCDRHRQPTCRRCFDAQASRNLPRHSYSYICHHRCDRRRLSRSIRRSNQLSARHIRLHAAHRSAASHRGEP